MRTLTLDIRDCVTTWDTERRAYTTDCTDTHGLSMMAASALRAPDGKRLTAFMDAIGLPSHMDYLRDIVVSDLEDGRLGTAIYRWPHTDNASDVQRIDRCAIWRIDTHAYEHLVPDVLGGILTCDQIDQIHATGAYQVDPSGTFAHYCGPDRLYYLTVSEYDLSVWLSDLSQRYRVLQHHATLPDATMDELESGLLRLRQSLGTQVAAAASAADPVSTAAPSAAWPHHTRHRSDCQIVYLPPQFAHRSLPDRAL